MFFEDLALSMEKYSINNEIFFVRAVGFQELKKVCKIILNHPKFTEKFHEKWKTSDPWIYHNQDCNQFQRIAEFMAETLTQR